MELVSVYRVWLWRLFKLRTGNRALVRTLHSKDAPVPCQFPLLFQAALELPEKPSGWPGENPSILMVFARRPSECLSSCHPW